MNRILNRENHYIWLRFLAHGIDTQYCSIYLWAMNRAFSLILDRQRRLFIYRSIYIHSVISYIGKVFLSDIFECHIKGDRIENADKFAQRRYVRDNERKRALSISIQ